MTASDDGAEPDTLGVCPRCRASGAIVTLPATGRCPACRTLWERGPVGQMISVEQPDGVSGQPVPPARPAG